jgi:3-hydroxyethyl bacteriochlorophyllide a dehydrogenase
VVFEGPQRLTLGQVGLMAATATDVVVDVEWSGISTGTEKLLWTGEMPPFPGMGYPLVPGYESVGRVRAASADGRVAAGQRVFVPGARCFQDVRGLFGGAARRLVVPADRVVPIEDELEERGVLLALAATAQHALGDAADRLPELIVGHGVLGRLLARLTVAAGGRPVVWEANPDRAHGASGYVVIAPQEDSRRDYRVICDASGDPQLLDTLVARLAKGGEIVLAGFYATRLSFDFAPAFMREARLRIAAEFRETDLARVRALVRSGALSLDGLITHRVPAEHADHAYRTAFGDPACLKMVLDWRQHA